MKEYSALTSLALAIAHVSAPYVGAAFANIPALEAVPPAASGAPAADVPLDPVGRSTARGGSTVTGAATPDCNGAALDDIGSVMPADDIGAMVAIGATVGSATLGNASGRALL